MRADQTHDQAGFSEMLADLSDSDIVIEVLAGAGARRPPQVDDAQLVEDAVEASYRALAGSAQVRLERVAVLDELAKRSLSLWLRVETRGASNADGLTEGPDTALLKFLARGTLAIIAWMDGSPTLQLANLQQAMRVLAWGTSVTTTAQPVLPSSAELVEAICAWQRAKKALGPNDSVRIVTTNGSATLDLSKRIADPRALLLARKLVNHSADMIFVVEMPDYHGTGQWQLKHGGSSTGVIVEPGTMLDKFYRRELDIRPGDALRCRVDVETSYGPDHEVLGERFRIVEILEILPASRADGDSAEASRAPSVAAKSTEEFEPAK
jgi:hypothetical protein